MSIYYVFDVPWLDVFLKCVAKCWFKFHRSWNSLLQILQTYDFRPLWVFKWRFKVGRWLKDFGHKLHWNGLSPLLKSKNFNLYSEFFLFSLQIFTYEFVDVARVGFGKRTFLSKSCKRTLLMVKYSPNRYLWSTNLYFVRFLLIKK